MRVTALATLAVAVVLVVAGVVLVVRQRRAARAARREPARRGAAATWLAAPCRATTAGGDRRRWTASRRPRPTSMATVRRATRTTFVDGERTGSCPARTSTRRGKASSTSPHRSTTSTRRRRAPTSLALIVPLARRAGRGGVVRRRSHAATGRADPRRGRRDRARPSSIGGCRSRPATTRSPDSP